MPPVTRPLGIAALLLFAPLTLAACGSPTPATPAGGSSTAPSASASAVPSATPEKLDVAALEALEQEFAARVGVFALDTATGASVEYRVDERFGYASTLKAVAAGVLLAQTNEADLGAVQFWGSSDLAGYSPVTEQHVGTGLPLGELAEAAVRQSDNTALNVVLDNLGGPAGLDAALTALGDDVTSVDRAEPELNDVVAGDDRDTTTPRAFAGVLRELAFEGALAPDDRATLLGWMAGNATGDPLIRAGAPDGWTVADKSGGAGAIRNDIAIVERPEGAPLVITVLTTRTDPDAEYDNTLVARAAAIVFDAFD